MYPVSLDVEGRPCLVVGGGAVALRKVEGLLEEGALVTVVAPAPIARLRGLAARERIHLEIRGYREAEVAGYTIVFAATDDRDTNRQVSRDAATASIWVNVADDPELCTFHLPAKVRRGSLCLAITSSGEAPFAVRRLREVLDDLFGEDWADWARSAAQFRRLVREHEPDPERREELYTRFFARTVEPDRLATHLPTEQQLMEWIEAGDSATLQGPWGPQSGGARARPAPEKEQNVGFVSLVGSGPGEAGLLTVKGLKRLRDADAIVYDRLAALALPCDLDSKVELYCVGKRARYHPVPQDEINVLLAELAGRGLRVVRLKGGDPFVFGRGGEELEVLVDEGIPFEVVPGVTAGVAVPAYAGIPVTHRRESVRLTMVTAHEAVKKGGQQVRWDLLASDPHATLVGYMGVSNLPDVVRQLLAGGMDPETPSAMIERGTTSQQRVATSGLADLPEEIRRVGIRPPALFAIGPAAGHAKRLRWFEVRPLHGERLVAHPSVPLGLTNALEYHGAELIRAPIPWTAATRVVVDALPITGILYGTRPEVDWTLRHEAELINPKRVVIWCLSSDARSAAVQSDWSQRHLVPDTVAEDPEAFVQFFIERRMRARPRTRCGEQ